MVCPVAHSPAGVRTSPPGYAIVFVNCHLPGMDGIDLIRNLRNLPGDQAKIVTISGSRTPGVEDRAKEAGVDRFERKGDSLADLRAAIARAFGLLEPAAS